MNDDIERLKLIEARYKWLISKIFTRGETCLALYEEFGGSPYKNETIREFMDRYIDEKLRSENEHG